MTPNMKIKYFIAPEEFKDPYAHMTNQISHISFSLFLTWFISGIFSFTVAAVAIVSLWVAWEAYHYYLTKNKVDFIEDLFFELSGVGIFIYPNFVFMAIVVLIWTTYVKSKRVD